MLQRNHSGVTETPETVAMADVAAIATQEYASSHRAHLVREAATMVLYVSVVEIAELAAIPEEHFAHGRATGPVGGALLAIVWGTAVGLAIAHWFAFLVAAPAFRGQSPTRLDAQIGRTQLPAMFYGVTALALGVAVALVKAKLAAH
jgi:hypothetical protein